MADQKQAEPDVPNHVPVLNADPDKNKPLPAKEHEARRKADAVLNADPDKNK